MQMIDISLFLSPDHLESLLVCDVSCLSTNQTVGYLKFSPSEQQEVPGSETARVLIGSKRRDPPVTSSTKNEHKAKSMKLISSNTQATQSSLKAPSNPVNRAGGKVDVSSMMSVNHNMSTNEKTFKCLFCDFETSHMRSITRHIETKHLPSSVVFNCRSCNYSSKFKHNLMRHYMKTHNMPAPAAEGMLTCI